jgi:hypothetical protein
MREGNSFFPRHDLLCSDPISQQRHHDAQVHDSIVCSYSTNANANSTGLSYLSQMHGICPAHASPATLAFVGVR